MGKRKVKILPELWGGNERILGGVLISRPKIDNPKPNRFSIRLDDETERKLKEYCKKENISKGEAVRQGIELILGEYNADKLDECMKYTGMTKTGVIRAGIELIYEKVGENLR